MMDNNLEQLWDEGVIRVFISHISDGKELAHDLKRYLQRRSIAAFVAHDDIEPMHQWETEIEHALFSMDLLVALLTPKFNASDWTDQEIGVAIGRCIPVVPVRMGKDPYGFLSKYQAVPGADETSKIADAIFEFALANSKFSVDGYIAILRKSPSYERSNHLAKYMPHIATISPEQEKALVDTFNTNSQVYHAWDIRHQIIPLLHRTTGNAYKITRSSQLRKANLDS